MDPSTGQSTRSHGTGVDRSNRPDRATLKRPTTTAVQEVANRPELAVSSALSQPTWMREPGKMISSPIGGSALSLERGTRTLDIKTFAEAKIIQGVSSPSATVSGSLGTAKAPTMLSSLRSPVMSSAPESPKGEESPDDDITAQGQEHNAPSGQSRTCISCRRSKVKCDKGSPCSRCARLKLECIAQTRGRGRPVASHKKAKVEPASPNNGTGSREVGGTGTAADRHLASMPSFFPGVISSTGTATSGVTSTTALGRGAQSHQTAPSLASDGPSRKGDDANTSNSFGFAADIASSHPLLDSSQGFHLSNSDAYRDESTNLEPSTRGSTGGGNSCLPPSAPQQSQGQGTSLGPPSHGYLETFDANRPFPHVMCSTTPLPSTATTGGGSLYGIVPPRSLPMPLPTSCGQSMSSERSSWPGVMNGVSDASVGGIGSNASGGQDHNREASTTSAWESMNTSSEVATTSRPGTATSSSITSSNTNGGANGNSNTTPGSSNSSSASDGFSPSTTGAERGDSSSNTATSSAGSRATFPNCVRTVGNGGSESKRNVLKAGLDPEDDHQQCSPETLTTDGRTPALWPESRRDGSVSSGNRGEGLAHKASKQGRWFVGIEQDQQQQTNSGGSTPLPAFPTASGTADRSDAGRDSEGIPSAVNTLSPTADPTDTIVDGFWRLFNGQEVNRPKAVMVIRHWALCALDRRSTRLLRKTVSMARALCINVAEILNDYSIYAMFHELLREAEAGNPVTPARSTPFAHSRFEVPTYVRELASKIAAVSMRVVVRGQSCFYHNDMCEELFMSSEAANDMYATGKEDVWANFIHPDDHKTFFESLSLQLFHVPGHFSESSQILKCQDRGEVAFLALVNFRYEFQDGGNYAAFGVSVQPLPKSPYLLNPTSRENGHCPTLTSSPLPRPLPSGLGGGMGVGTPCTSGLSAGVGALNVSSAANSDGGMHPSLASRHGNSLPSLTVDSRRVGRGLSQNDVWVTTTHPSPPPLRNVKQGDVQLPPPPTSPSQEPQHHQQSQQPQHRAWADVTGSDMGVGVGNGPGTVGLADGVCGMTTTVIGHGLGDGSESSLRQDGGWASRSEPSSRMRFEGGSTGANNVQTSVVTASDVTGGGRVKAIPTVSACQAFPPP